MKTTDNTNKRDATLGRLKEIVATIKQRGEPVEIYWSDDADGPWDEHRHGAWGGNFGLLSDLREWIKNHQPDGRTITVYCRGDYRELNF